MTQVLDDGLLHFKTRRDGEEVGQSIDVLILRLTCEECIDAHRLPEDAQGRYKPNAAFLIDLAARLGSIGVADCTPSVAYQLWIASAGEIERLKKNDNATPNSLSGSESSQAEAVTTDY